MRHPHLQLLERAQGLSDLFTGVQLSEGFSHLWSQASLVSEVPAAHEAPSLCLWELPGLCALSSPKGFCLGLFPG